MEQLASFDINMITLEIHNTATREVEDDHDQRDMYSTRYIQQSQIDILQAKLDNAYQRLEIERKHRILSNNLIVQLSQISKENNNNNNGHNSNDKQEIKNQLKELNQIIDKLWSERTMLMGRFEQLDRTCNDVVLSLLQRIQEMEVQLKSQQQVLEMERSQWMYERQLLLNSVTTIEKERDQLKLKSLSMFNKLNNIYNQQLNNNHQNVNQNNNNINQKLHCNYFKHDNHRQVNVNYLQDSINM